MKQSIRNTFALCAFAGCVLGAANIVQAQTAPAPAEPTMTAPAGMADPSAADAAKAAAKPHPKEAKPAAKQNPVAVVTVTNKRAVALTELDATPVGGGEAVKILANLAPGKKATAKVTHGKDCAFDLRGAFDDGSTTEMPGVDLCKVKTLNLVE